MERERRIQGALEQAQRKLNSVTELGENRRAAGAVEAVGDKSGGFARPHCPTISNKLCRHSDSASVVGTLNCASDTAIGCLTLDRETALLIVAGGEVADAGEGSPGATKLIDSGHALFGIQSPSRISPRVQGGGRSTVHLSAFYEAPFRGDWSLYDIGYCELISWACLDASPIAGGELEPLLLVEWTDCPTGLASAFFGVLPICFGRGHGTIRSASIRPPKDEARRIASNIAKLPRLIRRP